MSRGSTLAVILILAAVVYFVWVFFGGSEGVLGVVTGPGSKTDLLARGIATAEGFYVTGSRPARNNNPGDLEISGDQGVDPGGFGIFSSADYAQALAGLADARTDGWAALFSECARILAGTARVCPLGVDTPWTTVAEGYDQGGDALTAWLPNVANIAGMDTTGTVGDWVNS